MAPEEEPRSPCRRRLRHATTRGLTKTFRAWTSSVAVVTVRDDHGLHVGYLSPYCTLGDLCSVRQRVFDVTPGDVALA